MRRRRATPRTPPSKPHPIVNKVKLARGRSALNRIVRTNVRRQTIRTKSSETRESWLLVRSDIVTVNSALGPPFIARLNHPDAHARALCARVFGTTGILRKTHRPAKSLIRPDKCSTIKPRAIRWKNVESQPWKNGTAVCPRALLLGVKGGTIRRARRMQIFVNLSICFFKSRSLCTAYNVVFNTYRESLLVTI